MKEIFEVFKKAWFATPTIVRVVIVAFYLIGFLFIGLAGAGLVKYLFN